MAPKMLKSSSTGDLSSEMADLQMYLHRQFEMQTKLLEDLHQDVKALLASPGSNPFTFIFDPEPGVGTVSSNPFPRQVSNGSALPPMASPVTASIQQVSSSFSLPPRPSREQPPAPPSPLALPVPQPDAVMPATSDARPTFMSVDEDSESDSEKKNPRGSVVSQRTTLVARDMLEKHLKARRTEEQADVDKDLGEVLHGDLSGPTLKLRLRKWVLSTLFSNIIMVFIVANAILLGIEIDVSSRVGQNDIPAAFGIINVFFVVVFVVETVLKLVVMGCHEYWRGKSWKWNAFDFLIVGLSVAETCLDYFSQAVFSDGGGGSVRVMRALRLARTLRGVRLFRLLRYFAALRGLLLSIASTLGSLLWTLVLLQLLFYVFAVIFAQLVTDYCRFETIRVEEDVNAIPKCPDDLHYWANVMDSMHTLFMAITGGVNWFDAYAPLRKVSLAALWLMNLFIVIGFFTILNVVTGVFVNTAIEGASADKDMATLKQAQFRLSQIAALRDVFQEIATEQRDTLNFQDLEDALHADKLGTFMESLGISTDDVWTLFLLIDVDASGRVDIEEFVSGCMQLRGPAQSLQVAKMSYENKLTRQRINRLTKDMAEVKHALNHLKKLLRWSRPVQVVSNVL